MNIIHQRDVIWPSGDCRPVLATNLTPEELSERSSISIFRDQDDLDWFTGALVEWVGVGSLLVMRHDNNPLRLTAFYVDIGVDVADAQDRICNMFGLDADSIKWRLS